MLTDGQAQAGTFVTSRAGIVALFEEPEDRGLQRGFDADALVLHLEADRHGFLYHPDKTRAKRDAARRRELDRIADQIAQDMTQAHGVPDEGRGQVRIDLQGKLQPLGFGAPAPQRCDRLEHRPQDEMLGLDVDLARFQAGDIDDAVHDAHQLQSRLLDLLYALAQAGFSKLTFQQSGETQDTVHRCPQLVADIRQEQTLGAVCRLRLDHGIAKALCAFLHALLQFGIELLQLVVEPEEQSLPFPQREVHSHPGAHHVPVDRFVDEIDAPCGEGPGLAVGVVTRRDEDDGNPCRTRVPLQRLADRIPVHAGHHDVQQDQVRCVLSQQLQRLGAGEGALNVVVGSEKLADDLDVFGQVVDDQQLGAMRHGGTRHGGSWLFNHGTSGFIRCRRAFAGGAEHGAVSRFARFMAVPYGWP